ncbi:MAG: c-type cytochrome, partial [Pseudomonadota bacterium]
YVLNLGNILPPDFTLSDKNIREVQGMLPNRNGMTTAHAMWPGKELGGIAKPDVQGSACVSNCGPEAVVKSFLPDYARNAHGNLAGQSRMIGASRGADTTQPPPAVLAQSGQGTLAKPAAAPAEMKPAAAPVSSGPTTASVTPLLQKNACLACHGMNSKLVGPGFNEIAARYKGRADAVNYLSGKIRSGGQGVWGAIPMPAQSLSEAEAAQVAQWLANGMPR